MLAKGAALWVAVTGASLTSAYGAAILYWDGDGTGAVGGGAGTWDITGAHWSTTEDGSTYQAWNNTTNDDAVFSGPGGATAVAPAAAVPITVNSLTFKIGGYTLGTSTTPFSFNVGTPNGTLTLDAQTGITVINAQYNVNVGTIVKTGTGLLSSGITQAAGGFAGKWIVNNGILSLPGDGRLGVVPTTLVPDQVTLDGGYLRTSTPTVAFNANRGITLGLNGGGFDSTNTGSLTWAGPISGNMGGFLSKKSSAILILTSDASTYDGITKVEGGKLTVGAANALGSIVAGTEVSNNAELLFTGATSTFTTNEPLQISGTGSSFARGAIVVETNANVTLGGTVTLASDATVMVAGNASVTFSNPISFTTLLDRTLTLQGDALTTGTGGTIAGAITLGTGGVTKEGDGKWTLSGASNYSGFTAINAGMLVVSGSLSGTAQIDVIGALSGNGTITPAAGGNVSIIGGGKLAPGAGAGTLSTVFSGGGQMDIGSAVFGLNSQSLLFELGAPGASDKVAITGGALSIGAGSLEFDDFVFSIIAGFIPVADYVLFDGAMPINGTLGANRAGTIGEFTAELQLADGGNDIILHVVPEPSAASALLCGIASLLGLRRRRS